MCKMYNVQAVCSFKLFYLIGIRFQISFVAENFSFDKYNTSKRFYFFSAHQKPTQKHPEKEAKHSLLGMLFASRLGYAAEALFSKRIQSKVNAKLL